MTKPKSSNRAQFVERSERDIVALARLILSLLSSTSNILIAIEELKKFFPRLQVKVVDDDLLPKTREAHAHPKRWIIRIKRSIYEGLLRGSTRGRWTLIHELGHVLLQHPGRPARDIDVIENVRTKGGRIEREADKFARSILLPFDRFANSSLDNVIKESSASFKSAERRIREFAEARAIRAAIQRRGLDIRFYTSEFGHQERLERQIAIVAKSISETLQEDEIESSHLIEPIKNNIFSTSVLIGAASGLLLNAFESFTRKRCSSEWTEASVLALTIITICPLRPIGSLLKQKAPFSNLKCAMKAAGKVSNLTAGELNPPYFLLPENRQAPYESFFLREIENKGDRLIKSPSTVLTLEDFPLYEEYNENCDVIWDDIHTIEYLADYFYILDRSSKK
jgi:Zn-dependent peptidase ImmA (M78 family)